jgi:hypothetical protein
LTGRSIASGIHYERLVRLADCLAAVVAVSLPWSTSATGILLVAWLLAVIPTLTWSDLRRELMTAAGGLPVLLVLLGMLGMLWADVTLIERWSGLESFLKLLVIPLLFVQFRRSDRGSKVFIGYVTSCVVLLAASSIIAATPALSKAMMHYDSVFVKNAATQSGEFVTCIFGLLFLLIETLERRRWPLFVGLLIVILGMLTNILYVANGRTALIIIPILLVIFAVRQLTTRGAYILFAGAILVGAFAWYSSPYLREHSMQAWTDFESYQATDERNSSGERIEFWRKSVNFVRAAPIIGNGTGSIHSLFVKSSTGQTGASAVVAANPHNQTFAVAIQLGLLGGVVLWVMWIAHLLLFRAAGLAEWVGVVVVVQNIVGSLFNSHLFDFVQGWVYVVGVGVAGGMALKNQEKLKYSSVAT